MLAIDPARSAVDIDVSATADSFTVHMQRFSASIAVDGEVGNVVTADVHFRFADLKTGDDERDAEMDSWAQMEQFPDGGFTLDSAGQGDSGQYSVRGRLRLHGVERDVQIPVLVSVNPQGLVMEGTASLDTRDYGLPVYRKFFFFKVDPVVQVRFRLVGRLVVP